MLADPTILLVDDNAGDVDLLRLALRTVAPAIDLQHIPEAAHAQSFLGVIRPTLALIEVGALLEGIALVEWVRSQSKLESMPVYVLAGATVAPSVSDLAVCAGAAGYLVRPATVSAWHDRARTLARLCERCQTVDTGNDPAVFRRLCNSCGIDPDAVASDSQQSHVVTARTRIVARLKGMGWPDKRIAVQIPQSIRNLQRIAARSPISGVR